MSLPVQFTLVVLGLLGSAFFSGMETGIVSVNRLRVEHMVREGRRRARTLQFFVEHPDITLGTALVGNNLCNVMTAVSATSIGLALGGAAGSAIAYGILTVVMLVVGEYLPKAYFQARPAIRSLPLIGLFRWFSYVFHPASRVATLIARVVIPIHIPRGQSLAPPVSRDGLKHLVEGSMGMGEVSEQERAMIERVVDMHRVRCRDVMTPAADMVCVLDTSPRADILARAEQAGLSRLPVRKAEGGDIVGTLHIMDVLRDPRPGLVARDVMRPPLRVPGEMAAHSALPPMRGHRQALALVTDRQDQVIGLITAEDILAQIVGYAGELRPRTAPRKSKASL